MAPPHEDGDRGAAWRRAANALGMALLTLAHLTSLAVGGYDQWPSWAAVANFLGLALLLAAALAGRLAR